MSGDRKAAPAGADNVVNHRRQNVAATVRSVIAAGVDIVVEAAGAANAGTNVAVLAQHGVVACYGGIVEDRLVLPIRSLIDLNVSWHGVFLYTTRGTAPRRHRGQGTGRRPGRDLTPVVPAALGGDPC